MPVAAPSSASSDLRSPLLYPAQPPAGDGEYATEKLCIDHMLRKYCGEFGFWQYKHFVLTSLAWALEAFHTMVMIFADREPGWRCVGQVSDCSSGAGSVCGLEPGSWEWVGGPGSSTVAEWGLVCGQKYKVGLVQALFFGGCMIGQFSLLSNYNHFVWLPNFAIGKSLLYIQKLTTDENKVNIWPSLRLKIGTERISESPPSPTYWTYALFRLLTGFSTGGVGLCAFVLATEPVGPSKRGLAGMSTFYFFSGGIAVLSGVAYIFRSWRYLYIATSIPSILFLFIILPFVSESPRWYLVRGKMDQAMKIMHNIAIANGNFLPDGVSLAMDDESSTSPNYKEEVESKEAMTPRTRLRLILVVAINFSCSVVYYGLSINVVNLETNLYINVLVNAVAEMPAYILTAVLLDKFGRKPLGVGTQWFSGLFCILGSLLSGHGKWKVVRMVCGVLGIFGMAGTYNLLFIYATELFPTVVRNAALGCATQAAQMGAILAPFVVVLGGGIPFAVFGVCGLVGGILTFYLPETSNRPLYDTMNGMEDGESAWTVA
ncbi:LOW QUALITY PROTEIN: hypothetical protein RJ639_028177 [Escallonia herrerae]|uniref:Major facilitator superfamily (MFS) profile domain-containing protein n=1 Tax=Escallonia herrerae TaxID=1293975 RepID=A0AA89BKS6_9ASTE|nr:LOW QUALITY PROTEIN: hypothetical protein RJ639_028177 [Escallonia herrerae]